MLSTSLSRRQARSLLGLLLIFSVAMTLPNDHSSASSVHEKGEQAIEQPALPQLAVAHVVRQTNLVSDRPGVALIEDPFLINPWGVALTANGPFWVVNNGTDVATIYQGDVSGSPFVRTFGLSLVSIPPPSPSSSPSAKPAGIVANSTSDFAVPSGQPSAAPASFIFSTLLGALNGWQPNLGSSAPVVSFSSGHGYTGIAAGSNASGNFLFAADFTNGKIDVFDRNFNATSVSGKFVDVTVPSAFRPFNIQNLGGALYVTYRQIGAGGGFVRKFDTNGVRDSAFAINNGPLNMPWGLALAPPGAGPLGNKLLVGNNEISFLQQASSINAFDPATGAHLASLVDEGGAVLRINRLWALAFGNGVTGGDPNTLYFSSGLFFERHGLFGSLKPMVPATSVIKFSSEDFFTSENSGHIDITVTRTGDVSGTATVNYATVDDIGNGQGSAYQIALGKLTFNPGETSKSFRVLIVDNHMFAGGTTFGHQLFLSNPQGAGLTSPSMARLGIQDNEGDTPGQPPNIVDQAQFFVRQHYFDFLNRVPDQGGFNFWVNEITSCGTNQQCIEIKRINVSAAFFLSIEFQRTGMLAYLTHKAAGFGFLPRYGPFMRDIQLLQKDFVFGAPGADAQLEANKQLYFNEFVAGPEFVARFAGLTNAVYVDTLILNTGVVFSTVERDALVNGLNGGTETRATVLRKIAEKESFRQNEFNRAFVLMEYFGYLRRHPGRFPDFNLDGFNFWLNKLNSFNGDFVRSEMVKAFITSIEYRSRFGPP